MITGDGLIGLGLVAIAGFTRGFSGFGSAMILAPSLSLLFNPQQVVVTVILLEMTAAAGLIPEAIPQTKWREVLPLALSAALLVPVGAHFLTLLEPNLMRRIIGGLILGFVLLLWSGKSHYSQPRLTWTSGVGALSGFLTGLAGIGGPPVVLYQMSGNNSPAANRANFIVFFALTQSVALITFWINGILSLAVWLLFISLVPGFLAGLALGRFCFKRVEDKRFRQFVLSLLIGVAVLALVA